MTEDDGESRTPDNTPRASDAPRDDTEAQTPHEAAEAQTEPVHRTEQHRQSTGDGSEDDTRVIPVVPSDAPLAYSEAPTAGAPSAGVPGADATQQYAAPAEPQTPDTAPGRLGAAPWAKVAAVAGGVVALLGIGYAVDVIASSGKLPRGATVAGVDVGGQSREAAEATLRAAIDPRADQPVAVHAGDVDGEIVPSAAGLAVDWDATIDHVSSQPLNPFTRLASFFTTTEQGVVSSRDDIALAASIDTLRGTADRAPREGTIVFEGANPVPVSPAPGQSIDAAAAADAFADEWAFGRAVELPVESVDVTVSQDAVDRALHDVAIPATSADLVAHGRDGLEARIPREQIGAVLSFAPDGDGGLAPAFDAEAATGILAPQLKPSEVEPRDAKIELSGGAPTVVPSIDGNLVAWPRTLEQLPQAVVDTHRLDVVYEPKPAALTTDAANKLGVREVIGEFTTGGFAAESGVNIRLAASEIDGALIKPGETFSLNGYTGPRGTAEGYVDAGIINNGRPDTAVGGGVSQVATTLYNAAYFSGMEDVDHTEHSYYISRYPEAREATVFEGAIDLKFRNPSDTGVLVQAIGGSSELTIRFWGTKTVDVQSITGERSKFTEPKTIRLPAGPDCAASSGAQGFTTSDTRVVSDHATGREISRDTRTVRYDQQPTVVCEEPDKPAAAAESASETTSAAPTSSSARPTTTRRSSRDDGE
ncbi:VanW family protein [Rhodococcus sp. HNM0569]|uniref:VanW family protein n=1 Tax=Rhodococcus sp. HNM0569 TaxID=2716340 RepID=UPI00197D5C60|nr:VanW family protein [Rhodococcus sp. HNM0569]